MSTAQTLTGFSISEDVFSFSAADNEIVLANIGDYGVENENEQKVADLVESWSPDAIFTNGDNSQAGVDYSDDVGAYYGDFVTRGKIFPCPGNHDWEDGTLANYLAYFTGIIGQNYYYQKSLGPLTIFMLDGNVYTPDGYDSDSTQAAWLVDAVSKCRSPWKVASIHASPYCSDASHGSSTNSQWDFSGLDIVFSGHSHVYERLYSDGIWYVVNGLGGSTPYEFGDILDESRFQYNTTLGAGKLIATPKKLTWRFYTWSGSLVDALSLEQ